ncbi:MAG: C-GCAxxG-C-C family protein [Candidatus Limnocylindrales bacterium]|jgi:C_GCAxxG_C_C family probable redox protein
MTADQLVTRARALFLDDDHTYGCAETTFLVLKEAFGLPDALDTSAAMVLNGGIAYSGGVCGALSGAALAVGLLAGQRLADHRVGKRTAREIVVRLMDDFQASYGAVDCRALLGREIRTSAQHQVFLDSGIWRDVCMTQIEFVVTRLGALPDDPIWDQQCATAELPAGRIAR